METATLKPNVWPQGQKLQRWLEPTVAIVQFADHQDYHDDLRRAVLAQSQNPEFAKDYGQHSNVGSVKVFELPKWNNAAAALIDERAQIFFKKVAKSDTASVDMSWATIYNAGDSCLPHAHPRTSASILYMLDEGDGSAEDSGQFCFADPRMTICCQEEKGYMSTPCAPKLRPGMMMLFPGQAVHFVTTYDGSRPRITLTWNFNILPRAGEPLPDGGKPPGWQN